VSCPTWPLRCAAMTDEAHPPAEQQVPEPAAGPAQPRSEPLRLGQFTDADLRMLVITIAGTVVGALLTAVIIGLAVILARGFRSSGGADLDGWYDLVILPIAAAVTAALVVTNRGRGFSAVNWLEIAVLVTLGVIALLVWVGLAAGIR
jgi:hypothetical protein